MRAQGNLHLSPRAQRRKLSPRAPSLPPPPSVCPRRWRCTTGAQRRCGRASIRASVRSSWRAAGSRRRGTPAVAAAGEAREHQELTASSSWGGGRRRVVELGRRPVVPPIARPFRGSAHSTSSPTIPFSSVVHLFFTAPRVRPLQIRLPGRRPLRVHPLTSTLPTPSQARPRRRCRFPFVWTLATCGNMFCVIERQSIS